MTRPYFKEEQKFRQAWVWIIILVSLVAWTYSVIASFMDDKNEGLTNDAIIVIAMGIIPLALLYLFFSIKLLTNVDQDGIHYKFTILQRKFKTIKPEEISTYEIRKYNALTEYGGYGIRLGRGHRGKAFNVGGNMGMQFVFKNGKKFLLGTHQPEAFKRAVEKLIKN